MTSIQNYVYGTNTNNSAIHGGISFANLAPVITTTAFSGGSVNDRFKHMIVPIGLVIDEKDTYNTGGGNIKHSEINPLNIDVLPEKEYNSLLTQMDSSNFRKNKNIGGKLTYKQSKQSSTQNRNKTRRSNK